ncbi:MAG: hypothetical protein GXO89_06915 [Chlorobi bacterium]|nr:hypothetical protein [Chlorobiota bacterium]
MKKISILIIFAFLAVSGPAQKLIDIYKKGTIKLVPDLKFAQNNNWDSVFKSYYDTVYGSPMGNRKSLIIMPDGSVLVNNRYRNFYTKFSPNGKFEKEFGITNSNGKKFKKTESIAGVLNNKILFSNLDNIGNMICSDLDGNYIKTLQLDYITRQMISLSHNKIAVVGWAIWSDRFRDFVAIVDYETNEEKIIWDYFSDRCGETEHCDLFSYKYDFESHGSILFSTMPYINNIGMASPPKIAWIGNKLVVAIPTTGEILVYDIEGNQISKDKITWAVHEISVKEQKEIQQKAIDKFKSKKNPKFADWASPEENMKANKELIAEMESDLKEISKPIKIPYFSTILKDSDNNLLFFEFPKEENSNKFNVWVYGNKGHFIGQSSFVCDGYHLQINPSKMVFHKGYLYALQLKKNVSGVPLRLVRFKLANE